MKQFLQQAWLVIGLTFLLSLSAVAQTYYTIGTSSGNNTSTAFPCAMQDYWEGSRAQYLYRQTDLVAAGMSAGNITHLRLNVITAASGAGVIENFTIKILFTSVAALGATTWEAGAVTVYGPLNFTDNTTGVKTFDITDVAWNGTDNIIVEICNGQVPANAAVWYTNNRVLAYQTMAYNASRSYAADNLTSSACGTTLATNGSVTPNATRRPLIDFGMVAASPCAGTPAPGNTTGPASACSAASFLLGLQNSTPGNNVTYQWQSADDALFSVNLANLGTSASQSTSQTTAKYYRCNVTCPTATPPTTASNPLYVAMGGACQCGTYCNSAFTNVTYEFVTNVNFAGINQSSVGVTGGPVNYTGGPSGNVVPGNTYPLSVTIEADANDYIYVWFDWNQNGLFTDAGEQTTVVAATSAAGPHTVNITVPGGALTGSARMRVMCDWNNAVPNPCRSATYGEAEDYCVTVAPPPPCSGTPTPGNTLTSSAIACTGGVVNLSLQNATLGTGVTYDWQSADDAAFTAGVATGLAAAATYSPAITATKYFRCVVTCPSATPPSGTSTPVLVTLGTSPVGGTISGPTSGCTNTYPLYTLAGSTGNIMWQVATAGAGGPYTDLGITTATTNLGATATGTYYVRCKLSGTGCPDDYSNILTLVVNCVGGDNVCSALPLNMGINGAFSNVGATVEAGEAALTGMFGATNCNTQAAPWSWCELALSNTLWFTFVAPPSGRVEILANGWDNQIAVYDAPACSPFSSFTLVAANDDGNPSVTSFDAGILDLKCLIPGHTYYLQLDGYIGATGTNTITINPLTNSAPVVSGCPANINIAAPDNAGCTGIATWTAPTATDAEGTCVTMSSTHNSGDAFPVGTTTVTYTFTDNAGATGTCSFTVTVANPLTAGFTHSEVNLQATFNNTSAAATSYFWDFGDGNTSTATNPVHQYAAGGTYTVTLTAYSAYCSATYSESVTVSCAAFTATWAVVSHQMACPHFNDVFQATPAAGGGNTYQWFRNNISLGAPSGSDTYSATLIGNYKVTVSQLGCIATSASAYVNPQPTLSPSGWQFVCNGPVFTTTTISVNPNSLGVGYQWRRNGVDVLGETGPSITTGVAGTYRCSISYGACPNKITGNNAVVVYSAAGQCQAKTDVTTVEALSMNVFPNPASDVANIELSGNITSATATVQIFNVLGEEVSSLNINEGDMVLQVNTSDLASGMYIVRVTDGATILTGKLNVSK